MSWIMVWFSDIPCIKLSTWVRGQFTPFILGLVTKWAKFPSSLPTKISTDRHAKIVRTTGNAPPREKLNKINVGYHPEGYETSLFGRGQFPVTFSVELVFILIPKDRSLDCSDKDGSCLGNYRAHFVELFPHQWMDPNFFISGMDHDMLQASLLLKKVHGIIVKRRKVVLNNHAEFSIVQIFQTHLHHFIAQLVEDPKQYKKVTPV